MWLYSNYPSKRSYLAICEDTQSSMSWLAVIWMKFNTLLMICKFSRFRNYSWLSFPGLARCFHSLEISFHVMQLSSILLPVVSPLFCTVRKELFYYMLVCVAHLSVPCSRSPDTLLRIADCTKFILTDFDMLEHFITGGLVVVIGCSRDVHYLLPYVGMLFSTSCLTFLITGGFVAIRPWSRYACYLSSKIGLLDYWNLNSIA